MHERIFDAIPCKIIIIIIITSFSIILNDKADSVGVKNRNEKKKGKKQSI